jgi:two-component system cell cycle sensor histidine kinase/response regulator CckA
LGLDTPKKDIILICDDEEIVLRTCSIAVARAGLRAVVAENGVAGLETFIDLRDEICLVLADIIMPVMSGIEMSEKILQIDKHAKILLMSGYSDSVIELEGRNRFPFIRKPFIHAVLIDRIHSLVGDCNSASSSSD